MSKTGNGYKRKIIEFENLENYVKKEIINEQS